MNLSTLLNNPDVLIATIASATELAKWSNGVDGERKPLRRAAENFLVRLFDAAKEKELGDARGQRDSERASGQAARSGDVQVPDPAG